MRAAVYHGPGDVRFEEVPAPNARSGELLLRVGTVGICGSDLGEYLHDPHFFPISHRHPFSGHIGPTIPGHEFSGEVVGVGEGVIGFEIGDKVASGAGVACGVCEPCQMGRTNMCLSYWTVGLHANGAMTELVATPASCCTNLSRREISLDLAALAQPMSIALHASRRGRAGEGDRVVILGSGGIGTFLTYANSAGGARVTAVDIDQAKLDVAQVLGAQAVVNHSIDEPDIKDRIVALGGPPTLVFECTASAPGIRLAASLVADNGRVVIVGHQPRPVEFDFKQISFGEKELIGTMAHAFGTDFDDAIELLLRQPEIWSKVAPIVYPIEDFLEAGILPMAERRQTQIKTLFDPSLTEPRPLRVFP